MKGKKRGTFEKFALWATQVAGSTITFLSACSLIILWIITGPIFNFSDTWQLIINTSTTIITFLMVFLIQKTQNKEAIATQIKLNELIAAHDKTSNSIISVEDLTEEELRIVSHYYQVLAKKAKSEKEIHKSHSIDEVRTRKKD